nr:hypothetical protein B11C_120023 [Bartonella sp. 1-1C]
MYLVSKYSYVIVEKYYLLCNNLSSYLVIKLLLAALIKI